MIEIHNDITRFIKHTYEEIEKQFNDYENIEFHKINLVNGTLYIVYESKIRFVKERIASYELKENGIILEKNNNFYYYNLKENYENKKKIIKKFVEKYYRG